MGVRRPCASPICHCETDSVTCSLWCGPLDLLAGDRCRCRHDDCLTAPAARLPLSGADDRAAALALASRRRVVVS
jgi:hypothetical protein